MDFTLTTSQELLVRNAREFFHQRCPTTLVQALALDDQGFPEPLWREIAALGWPGLLIADKWGGSNGDLLDVILLVEEMGYACFPSPFIQSAVVAAHVLSASPQHEQQQRSLPAMARGERLVILAFTEESADYTPESVMLSGEVGGRLSGSKLFVKDAHIADELIVVVRGGNGLTLLLVERNTPGVTLYPMTTMSGEKQFEVAFKDLEIRPDMLLSPAGQGWDLLAPALLIGALARSAEMVGCSQRILDMCVEYAKVREQSGQPIGVFQAIQHHCANLLRNVEGSRYILYNAAWRMQTGLACDADVAMAKSFASEACLEVARLGHQIHGAIGYCEEHPLHLFHKRIHAASLDFGDASLHLETVAQSLGLA
jgi:alkylation response protein AidB-like acyl-CoA dehydrogenase